MVWWLINNQFGRLRRGVALTNPMGESHVTPVIQALPTWILFKQLKSINIRQILFVDIDYVADSDEAGSSKLRKEVHAASTIIGCAMIFIVMSSTFVVL